ncbi:MAG: serine/threonine protein kinase [Verrucomicrobia bacterium]|nr:serine/threonine protein kinase [Verrucomicrobiota bacterium]
MSPAGDSENSSPPAVESAPPPAPAAEDGSAAPPAEVQVCPGCAAWLDVSEQEPLARIHCPICGTGLQVERRFDHFVITEKLGAGGMGAVYRATDVHLHRPVALKLLHKESSTDPEFIAKFEDEARITASINHPHVVKIFSFGEDHGQYYLAMELVDKGSLDDLMQLQGRVAELQVLTVGRQIAEGLQAAHEAGLIHRDVKPGNILFADAHTAKITDFGLALLAEHEAESRGEIWGTPYYIAPEKLNQEPEDFRSDIYSLGGTLFHAVAGRPPFEAENASLVALKHLKSQAVSLQAFAPDVSAETAYVVNRMLHKDPAQRYESYGELIEHLQYATDKLRERTAQPRRPRARVELETEKTRSLSGIFTLLLLLALLAGIGLVYAHRAQFFQTGENRPSDETAAALRAQREAEARKRDAQSLEEAFQAARAQLVAGNFATAQSNFADLSRRQGMIRPRIDWVRYHQILAALLDRQVGAADALIADENQAGFFSKEPADLPLANFFSQTAKFLADPGKPVPVSALKAFNKDSVEAFSLLLFGLRDWEVGAMDDAAKLLRAFADGKLPASYRWIGDYKPFAEQHWHDYQSYALLRERLRNATTAEALTKLNADLAKARGDLQTSGKIVELLDVMQADIDSRLGTTRKQESENALTRATSEHDADKNRWLAARETVQQVLRRYRFEEALATLGQLELHDPDFTVARDAARERARLLVAFKQRLIADINNTRGGYPQTVVTRANSTFPQGIKKAGPDKLDADTPYGQVTISWLDLDARTVLTMAVYFADKTTDPKAAAERRWQAAIFALEFGLVPDSRALAEKAAKERTEYQTELPQFYDKDGPPKR